MCIFDTESSRPSLVDWIERRMDHQKNGGMIRRSRVKKNNQLKKAWIYKPISSDIWNDFCEFTTLHGVKNMYHDFRYLNSASTKRLLSEK